MSPEQQSLLGCFLLLVGAAVLLVVGLVALSP